MVGGALGRIFDTLSQELSFDARFNTTGVLLTFLPIALIGYWRLPPGRARMVWLTVASFIFYSFWDYRFITIMLASSVIDFWLAKRIASSTDTKMRKRMMWGSVVLNLGLLAFFKYTIFVLENFQSLFDIVGLPIEMAIPKIVLPLGISFYTFQTMSYTIDVYRRDVQPTHDLAKYMAYVTMFPQLVAGPIVRYQTIGDQLDAVPRRPVWNTFNAGLVLFAIGLAKKVLVADWVAEQIDGYWSTADTLTIVQAWTAGAGYVVQMYFDFSGYSDMAIGLGGMLGIRFPLNFDGPHHSKDPSEWWRRWHISLSAFLRDYLFIPLGGSRVPVPRMYFNLFLVMFLAGLWHGATWNMVIFGTIQGTYLVAHRSVRKWYDPLHPRLRQAIMMMFWTWSMIVLRAPNIDVGWTMIKAQWGIGTVSGWDGLETLGYVIALLAFSMIVKPAVRWKLPTGRSGMVLVGVLIALCFLVMRGTDSPFLYYQF